MSAQYNWWHLLHFSRHHSSGVSCKVCVGDVRENTPIPKVMGVTCKDIVTFATINETSDDCPALQYVEALCCPSAASMCSICKGTKLLVDGKVVDSTEATWTCGEVALAAANNGATSIDCEDFQDYQEYCCPENYAANWKSSITNPSPFSFIKLSPHSYSRYVFICLSLLAIQQLYACNVLVLNFAWPLFYWYYFSTLFKHVQSTSSFFCDNCLLLPIILLISPIALRLFYCLLH